LVTLGDTVWICSSKPIRDPSDCLTSITLYSNSWLQCPFSVVSHRVPFSVYRRNKSELSWHHTVVWKSRWRLYRPSSRLAPLLCPPQYNGGTADTIQRQMKSGCCVSIAPVTISMDWFNNDSTYVVISRTSTYHAASAASIHKNNRTAENDTGPLEALFLDRNRRFYKLIISIQLDNNPVKHNIIKRSHCSINI